jgi:hypothetical protein
MPEALNGWVIDQGSMEIPFTTISSGSGISHVQEGQTSVYRGTISDTINFLVPVTHL